MAAVIAVSILVGIGGGGLHAVAAALSEPELAVLKSGPVVVVPGERVDYTITYSNTGTAPAHDVRLVDDFPAALAFVSASGGGGLEGGDVAWDLGTIAPGGEGEVRLALDSSTSMPVGSMLTNTARITAPTASEADVSNNVSTHDTVVGVPDLALEMAGPTLVAPGGSASYVITVTNTGVARAQDVELVDELPAAMALIDASAGGEQLADNRVRWRFGEVTPGASRSVGVTATVQVTTGASRLVNRAAVSTATFEPWQGDNAAETGADVIPIDLRVSIQSPAGEIRPGQSVTHTVGVYNVSAVAAEQVTVGIDFGGLGSHVADTSDAGENGFARTIVGHGVEWRRDAIAGPSSYSVDLVTRVADSAPAGSELVYTATVAAATADNAPGNNVAHSDPIPVALPDLWLTKTGPAEVGPGGIATYTLRYGNSGDVGAPDTRVTDTLPAGIMFLDASPPASPAGEGVLTWDVGDVPAASQDIIRLWGRIRSDLPLGDAVANSAAIASPYGDEDPVDNGASAASLIVEGPPAAIELDAPNRLEVGGSSGAVTVEVRDSADNVVADGTAVVLDTTLGQLGAAHLRTAGGRVTTTLSTGPVPGSALVTAMAGEIVEQVRVPFVSGPPDDVAMTASPVAPKVGETVTLEVAVKDRFGNRVDDDFPVSLATDRGAVEPPIAPTRLGVATAEWLNTAAGTGVVTATAGAVTVTAELVFAPDGPARIELEAERTAVGVDGDPTALTAHVLDRFDNVVSDGTKIAFSASAGSVAPSSRSTIDGRAAATYRSGSDPGIATLTARAGDATGHLDVEVRPADLRLQGSVDGPRGRARESKTYPGEQLTYTLGVTNHDLSAVRDVVLGAAFPGTLSATGVSASQPVTETDSPPSGLLPPLQEGQVARFWRLPELAASQQLTLTLAGHLDADHDWGAFQTLFFRSAITSTTPEASLDDFDHSDQAAVHAADHFVGMELDSYASNVEAGGKLVYVLSFGNATAGDDGTVFITDSLPAATTYDHWQPGPGTDIRPASAFNSAARELVWEVDGKDAASGSVRLWLDIAQDAPTQQVIVNAAEIGATVYDFEPSNNSATDGGVWLSGVNLVASLDAEATVAPGGTFVSRFAVENKAQRDTARDVVVAARPPDGVELLRTDPPALVLSDGRVTWLREEMAPGSRLDMSATYRVPESASVGTVYTHEVEVESANAESYPGDNHRLATTRVVPGEPAELKLSADAEQIVACGSDETTITALVTDEHGNQVADGSTVTWSTSLGAMNVRTSSTVDGEARARLKASLSPGTAIVRARAGEIDGRIDVEMVPGPPRVLAVTASPRVVGHGGRTTITVEVLDECSNPVADGWPITLTADRGMFAGGSAVTTLYTLDGRVRARLRVGDQPGPLRVRAAYGQEWGETMISVDTRAAGSTIFLPRADSMYVLEPARVEAGSRRSNADSSAAVVDLAFEERR